MTTKNIQGSPDLLIEILSESNRKYDEVTKRALYERTGVGEIGSSIRLPTAVRVFRSNEAGNTNAPREYFAQSTS